MTRDEAEVELAGLLLERRRLARFNLQPSPKVVQRIRSLELMLYGVARMTRREAVTRYGMLPKDQILAFAEQGRDGGQYDPNNITDAVFADALEDADDPRHLIVRRDIEHRAGGTSTDAFIYNHREAHRKLGGSDTRPLGRTHPNYTDHDLPDGTSVSSNPWGSVDRYYNDEDAGPTSYEITWDTPHNVYYGAFSPEERDHILRGLQQPSDPPPEPDRLTRTRRAVVSQYGRITLSAPRTRTLMSGSVVHAHDLLDETGANVGHVEVIPRNDGKHIHVQHIGSGDNQTGNVLGAEAIRTALASFRKHYPDAEFISGFRTSGFRKRGSPRPDANEIDMTNPPERTTVDLRGNRLGRRRYSRPDEVNHNALITAIRENPDEATPRLEFADLLQEGGTPGAHVVRAHAQGMQTGTRTRHPHPGRVQPDISGYEGYSSSPIYSFSPDGSVDAVGEHEEVSRLLDTPHGLGAWLQLYTFGPAAHKRGVVLGVNHRVSAARTDTGVTHSTHVKTPGELRAMLADVPEPTRTQLLRTYLKRVKNPAKPVDQAAAAHTTRLSRRAVVRYAAPSEPTPPTGTGTPPSSQGPRYDSDGFLLRDPNEETAGQPHYMTSDPRVKVHALVPHSVRSLGYHHMTFAILRVPSGRHLWHKADWLGRYPSVEAYYRAGPRQYKPKVLDDNKSVVPLTPHELWAYDLPGGVAPDAEQQDYRPDDTIPEDFYAMSRRGVVRRYTLDINETIRQGIENSQRTPLQWGKDVVQDTNTGRVLADALDETSQPHAPFFRHLVPRMSGAFEPFETETGQYQLRETDLNHPIRRDVTDNGHRFTLRPVGSLSGGPPSVMVHRTVPGQFVILHTAVLHAPALREWAAHPKVGPSLRAALVNAADHLEGQVPEKLSRRRPRRYGADHHDVKSLLSQLQQHEHGPHMAGLDDPLSGLRGITADALDEQGRSDEAQLLRTPGRHVEVRADGTVKPSFMQRQTWGRPYPSGERPNEQFVKPSHHFITEAEDPGNEHHSFTFWFARHGTNGWRWSPDDGEGLHADDVEAEHPNYREYPSTDALEDGHPLSPSELSWMRSEARTGKFKKQRAGTPVRKSLVNRHDFLGALKRVASSNHSDFVKRAADVAKKMGMHHTKVLPALHDTPTGSVPGVAQAVYGEAPPDRVASLAAWVNGLLPNGPGYSVFHMRPQGPDTLYRFRHDGSGMDVRSKLDRAGITSRIMVPHRRGFDVLVPDVGNRLQKNVAQYAQQHGLQVEASEGYFKSAGSATDQGQSRDTFRNTVAKQEAQDGPTQLRREGKVRRYSSGVPETGVLTPEQMHIATSTLNDDARVDKSALGVLGDHLTESGYPNAGSTLSRFVNFDHGMTEVSGPYEPAHQTRRDAPEGTFWYENYPYGENHTQHVVTVKMPNGVYFLKYRHHKKHNFSRPKGHVWFKLIDAARGALKKVPTGPDYQRLFWHPESKTAHWMSADGDEEKHVRHIHRALKVPGVKKVTGDSESFPKGKGWVEIPVKRRKVKTGAKKYMKIHQRLTRPGFEHISDFQVPVLSRDGTRLHVFTPHRLTDGQGTNEWHWDTSAPPTVYPNEAHARRDHPHLLRWEEFTGPDNSTMQLTPHELYLATEGAEGHPENPETAPFEMAIRKEPTEATHRGVYADYLDEQGRGEDAAKQRAIGEHFRGTKFSRRRIVQCR